MCWTLALVKNVSFATQAILSPALKSPQAGAQTSIFCAVDESLEGVGDDHLTQDFSFRCLASILWTVKKARLQSRARIWRRLQDFGGKARR